MSILILLAALTAPQCENGVCTIDVQAAVVAPQTDTLPTAGHGIAPLRRTVKAMRGHTPLRSLRRRFAERPRRCLLRRACR